MEKITFVIPSRNNLEFLKLAYESIRELNTKHEILILNDGSSDGTLEWLESLNDTDLLIHNNPGPERIGIVGMFDKGIELARTEIIFAFHSDMIAAPMLDENILKHLKPGTVVSATRVEPPLHPPGPEKITQNFGIEVETFDRGQWEIFCDQAIKNEKITEGIFAPWCMYKKDFLAIGGHDELFAPQSKEDSDLFNRMQLAGYKFLQPWNALVYHFTSRGSRFNKHSGGSAGTNSQEWLETTTKNMRNFIRKWGHIVQHDKYMKPVIPPKYDIGIILKNCPNKELLLILEPWSSDIYTDCDIEPYIEEEQKNTTIDLSKKIHSIHAEVRNDIEIRIDANRLGEVDIRYICDMNSIIKDNEILEEDWGSSFRVGNLEIGINRVEECNIL
jgi:glycosyltransferase involved in cell wall biosynthesis